MEYYALALIAPLAFGQSATNTYTTDLNGRRVQSAAEVSTDHQRTEITQNLNGKIVPMQSTDERILRQEPNLKITERIVRKYDPNGQLVSTDRLLIEERTRSNGSTVQTTTYRTDLNGRSFQAARETVDTQKAGARTSVQTVIERPGINGAFQAVEKRTAAIETSGANTHEDETVYRPSDGGSYAVALRRVTETARVGNQTTEKTALYQPVGAVSQLQLAEQSVARTTKRADGSQVSEVTRYGASWGGVVGDTAAGPQVQAQEVIERVPGPGGSVTERRSVRLPAQSDPRTLGPLTKVSETVCTGKCQ